MESQFHLGEIVCLRASPDKSGPIIEILSPVGGMNRFRVFHSPTDIREYTADQLLPLVTSVVTDKLSQAITEGRWLPAKEFQARLTAARLANPQVDNLYALYSARIQHIPFQFKPMLRLLRADQPRLLIADEVGVGKTIEAGLILKELQTRQRLDSMLVVCPKALVYKWRAEMRRFDEEFRILTAESLQYCLKEAYLEGFWPVEYSRAIVHLELLRIDRYLVGEEGRRKPPGLLTLDPSPHFDLLIVDEAHHLRNPETNSYELAKFLCDASEAILFLSATPVHIGSRNLFVLLSLLRPDLFPDQAVFDEMIEPNRFINEAIRRLRTCNPEDSWQLQAAQMLDGAAWTNWGRQVLSYDPRFQEWQTRLSQPTRLEDVERVRCMRDLEEVHSLAHILNRTRRRDIGKFTIREPHTVTVPFTPAQQAFYDALIDFRQEVLRTHYDDAVVRLIIDTLERQAASSLPALLPSLANFVRDGFFSAAYISDDPDYEGLAGNIPSDIKLKGMQLLDKARRLPPEDPKFEQLQVIVQDALNGAGSGKVLVFSFFLHTLGYLEEKLSKLGVRVALITGKTPDEDREILRSRFRLTRNEDDAIDVLLSSEVGCEGLDYEFCDRLVNYDIPWNPMRIEQRIGRIDRYGQIAEKVLIFNFITPGTVEERIFYRCFERLGIFKETVGDLEEVLGDLVQDLMQIALDPSLTPAQADEKARQLADNALRLVEEEQRLEEESGATLGFDQAFLQEVDSLLVEQRFVSPTDLREMIESFVEEPELGGKITVDEAHKGLYRLRLRKESRDYLLDRIPREDRYHRPTMDFQRWLQGNDPYYLMTFEQKVALERRQIPFITPVHPLARIAVQYWTERMEALTSYLVIQNDAFPEGRYLFACELWETIGIRPEIRLIGIVFDLEQGNYSLEVSAGLVRLISNASEARQSFNPRTDQLSELLSKLDEKSYQLKLQELEELKRRNELLFARKLGSLEVFHRNRLSRVEAELAQAREERILRMKNAEKDRIERDYDRKYQDLINKRITDIVTRRIAAGVLEVGHAK
jgi:ATP-dependent helicase HepA